MKGRKRKMSGIIRLLTVRSKSLIVKVSFILELSQECRDNGEGRPKGVKEKDSAQFMHNLSCSIYHKDPILELSQSSSLRFIDGHYFSKSFWYFVLFGTNLKEKQNQKHFQSIVHEFISHNTSYRRLNYIFLPSPKCMMKKKVQRQDTK